MGLPLQLLQLRNPIEQVDDQAERGVAQIQFSMEPLDSGHRGDLRGLKPQATFGIPSHLKQPECR
jgi:hypothetical protein